MELVANEVCLCGQKGISKMCSVLVPIGAKMLAPVVYR